MAKVYRVTQCPAQAHTFAAAPLRVSGRVIASAPDVDHPSGELFLVDEREIYLLDVEPDAGLPCGPGGRVEITGQLGVDRYGIRLVRVQRMDCAA